MLLFLIEQMYTRAMRLQRSFQAHLLLMWLGLDRKGSE
jgi:hypothetical protein